MKRTSAVLSVWFVFGASYFTFEEIWHGHTSGRCLLIFAAVGGLCGVLIGVLNQIPKIYSSKVILQALLSSVIVLIVEGLSIVLTHNYVATFDNFTFGEMLVLGIKVTLEYMALWFVLNPSMIWVEDTLRYKLWGEGTNYSLRSIYSDMTSLR